MVEPLQWTELSNDSDCSVAEISSVFMESDRLGSGVTTNCRASLDSTDDVPADDGPCSTVHDPSIQN